MTKQNHYDSIYEFRQKRLGIIKQVVEAKKLYKDVADASRSCRAIAKTVHNSSFNRWTVKEEKLLEAMVAMMIAKHPSAFVTQEDTLVMFEEISLIMHRSPHALRIRWNAIKSKQKSIAKANLLSKAKGILSTKNN